jgi:hypothetical protein
MADLKISALTASTTPLAGTEVLPIVQSGTTKQVSVANLTAGRTQTSNGIVQGAAATGYNLTANTPAAGMTSQLLNWYEEGTWTPTQGAGLTVVGAFSSTGRYTRVGRQVTVNASVTGATSVACTSGSILCAGLPFTVLGDGSAGSYFNYDLNAGGVVDAYTASVYAVGAIAATSSIYFTITYFV